ncbi:MAG: hypothetical protein E7580_08045 [Ruminococcaceae bacterium]|nr:hypothetical protein [Oscillospiraceae bacterium]
MNSNKKATSLIAVYGIVIFLYVFIFVMLPFEKEDASWLSFGFTIFSMIASLFICAIAMGKDNSLVSKMYGIPVFKIGMYYVAAQFILGVLFCILAPMVDIPSWLPIILYVVLFCAVVIGVIATDNARDMALEIEQETKVNTRTITYFRIDIDGIADACNNLEVKAELEKLKEQFRYSDPVSSEATRESEAIVQAMLDELKVALTVGNTDEIRIQIQKTANALNTRNRICKANKR